MIDLPRRLQSLVPVTVQSPCEKTLEFVAERGEDGKGLIERKGSDSLHTPQRQLALIYLIFVAESIVSSSFDTQARNIASSTTVETLPQIYLQCLLSSSYALGGLAGIMWGLFISAIGRRPVALFGLVGSACCCFCMVDADSQELVQCALMRLMAGIMSSAVTVSVVTMLGDVTCRGDQKERSEVLARMPLVAACGWIGPVLQGILARTMQVAEHAEVSGRLQMISGSLVALVAVAALFLLSETGPTSIRIPFLAYHEIEPEKTPFVGQVPPGSLREPSISVIEVSSAESCDHVGLIELMQSPALLSVLASLCLLQFYGSAFESLLLQTGRSGPLLANKLTETPKFLFNLSLGLFVLHYVPAIVTRFGAIGAVRRFSILPPVLYVSAPVIILFLFDKWISPAPLASSILYIGHLSTTFSTIFHTLIILDMSPSSASTGTLVGLTHTSKLFQALGTAGGGGASALLGVEMLGGLPTTLVMWSALVIVSVLGVVVTWKVKNGSRLERNLDQESLGWEVSFEYDADAKVGLY